MKLPCACGGTVAAHPDRPGPGLRAHQETAQHVRWRRGIAGPLTVERLRELGYTVGVGVSDTPNKRDGSAPADSGRAGPSHLRVESACESG
jgi:hypothetical protein